MPGRAGFSVESDGYLGRGRPRRSGEEHGETGGDSTAFSPVTTDPLVMWKFVGDVTGELPA